jgi:hypothetical protein
METDQGQARPRDILNESNKGGAPEFMSTLSPGLGRGCFFGPLGQLGGRYARRERPAS